MIISTVYYFARTFNILPLFRKNYIYRVNRGNLGQGKFGTPMG